MQSIVCISFQKANYTCVLVKCCFQPGANSEAKALEKLNQISTRPVDYHASKKGEARQSNRFRSPTHALLLPPKRRFMLKAPTVCVCVCVCVFETDAQLSPRALSSRH